MAETKTPELSVTRRGGYPSNIAELRKKSPFTASPISERDHDEGEMHLIGGALPVPTTVKESGAASVGVSPIPAREDHFHGTGIVQSGIASTAASAQSIPNAAVTKITLNSTTTWADGGWIINSGDAVCPETGRFLAVGSVHFDTATVASTTRWSVFIYVNGAPHTPLVEQSEMNPASGSVVQLMTSAVLKLNAGDRVQLYVYHTFGAAKNLYATLTRTFLQVERMGTGAPGVQGPQGETGEKGDPGYYVFGLSVNTTTTTAAANNWTTLALNSTPNWNDGAFTISGNNAICTQAGRYLVICQAYLNTALAANARLAISPMINGVQTHQGTLSQSGYIYVTAFTPLPLINVTTYNLNVGDTVSFQVYQSSTSTPGINTAYTWMRIERLGAGPKGNDGATGPVGPQGIQGPQGAPGLDGGSGAVTGSIQMFAGDTAPSGFLFCDGSLKLTADYPTLFSVLGYKYGGSGVNFALPNLKGRIPVGLDTAVTLFNTLGKTGGSRNIGVITHVHDVTHVHPIPHAHDHTHYHSVDPPATNTTSVNAFSGSNMLEIASGNFDLSASEGLNNVAGGGSGPHIHNVNIPAFNSGNPNVLKTDGSDTANSSNGNPTGTDAPSGAISGTDQNVQPYQVVNYIIKT